jgi:hypothetical protein
VRVMSAMRGGDDDRLAVFEEELVAADEEILIHFDDVDRVSRVQGRYHERGWLERESGYLESCAWVARVREARIQHRSKTLDWAWRPEDDDANVADALCRLVEADCNDRLVLRAALSSAASEAEAMQCVNEWLANNPHNIEAPRVHYTRQALVVKVQGDEVWRVKYGPRHFGARYVDTLDELNARVAAMVRGLAHLTSAAEVFRGDSEKCARYDDDIARYEDAAPNARVALSRDVSSFSLECEGFSRYVFASLEIAAARCSTDVHIFMLQGI